MATSIGIRISFDASASCSPTGCDEAVLRVHCSSLWTPVDRVEDVLVMMSAIRTQAPWLLQHRSFVKSVAASAVSRAASTFSYFRRHIVNALI